MVEDRRHLRNTPLAEAPSFSRLGVGPESPVVIAGPSWSEIIGIGGVGSPGNAAVKDGHAPRAFRGLDLPPVWIPSIFLPGGDGVRAHLDCLFWMRVQ